VAELLRLPLLGTRGVRAVLFGALLFGLAAGCSLVSDSADESSSADPSRSVAENATSAVDTSDDAADTAEAATDEVAATGSDTTDAQGTQTEGSEGTESDAVQDDEELIFAADEPGSLRFVSPSGNITCGYRPSSAAVACHIANKQWDVRPEHVPEDGRCSLDYGNEVEIVAGELAAFTCRGDVPWYLDDDTVLQTLAYGEFLDVGPFLCLSETKGLSCWEGDNLLSGFTMARQPYPLLRAIAPVSPAGDPAKPEAGGEVIEIATEFVVFSSPSGNISCGSRLGGSPDLGLGPSVACWISEKAWEVRAQDVPLEEGFGPCELDYGNEVELALDSTARFTCRSDVPWYLPGDSLPSGTTELGTLAYGTWLFHGPIVCLSERTGLSCWTDGGGFGLARGTYPF
jgi:hypothetical protein